MIKLLIILLIFESYHVDSFKSGAPPSTCNDMIPKHGLEPQTSSPPYKLTYSLGKGGNYDVNITGPPFAGFILQARKDPSKPEIIGSFTEFSEDSKAIQCEGSPKNGALTHADNKLKENIHVEWKPPGGYEGDAVFVATVVYNYTTFWTKVSSSSFKLSTPPNDENNEAASGDTIPASLYDGCGARKNCLGSPTGCMEQRNCLAIITVTKGKNKHYFEMMALKSKYVAVGLSQDNKMGGDYVVECDYENHREGFEGVNVYRSWNLPSAKSNARLASQSGVILLDGKFADGNVYCKISLDSITKVSEITFNLDEEKYFLLLAAGTNTRAESLTYHDTVREAALDLRQIADVSPVIIHDEFYDGCNTEKNCFGYPDNCVATQQCQMVSSVAVEGAKYTFKIKSKIGAYVALGLSRDDKMGEDSVVECVRGPGNNIQVFMSWNEAGKKSNTRDKISQDGIDIINSSYEDGVIECEFVRKLSTNVNDQVFDLIKDKYYLLLVSGASLKERGVGYHDVAVAISGKSRALSDVGAFTSTSKLFLRLHGSFMIAAWIGTASIGIVFARYFKQTWVESSLCAKDLWFAWHRFFMLMTWSLTIVAFVLIFVEVGGWVSGNSQLHGILGCVTTILCFIQPFGAALRPHPTARNRPVFNWLHWLIGNAAHIFAIVTIFFAIPLAKAQLPSWLDWVLVAFVALYVSVHVLLTISGCISDRKSGKRVNSFPLKDMNTSRSALNNIERKQDAPHTGFRKFILFIHIVGITAITAAIIAIIALAPIEDQWSSLQNKLMSS